MYNIKNGISWCLLTGLVGYRLYAGSTSQNASEVEKKTDKLKDGMKTKKKKKEKALENVSLLKSNKWVVILDKVEIVLKTMKRCFKYPQKLVRKLKVYAQTGVFEFDGIGNWIRSPEAKKIAMIVAGSLAISYCNGGFRGIAKKSLGGKLLSGAGAILEGSRLVAVDEELVNRLFGFVQKPTDHILPLLVVGTVFMIDRLETA